MALPALLWLAVACGRLGYEEVRVDAGLAPDAPGDNQRTGGAHGGAAAGGGSFQGGSGGGPGMDGGAGGAPIADAGAGGSLGGATNGGSGGLTNGGATHGGATNGGSGGAANGGTTNGGSGGLTNGGTTNGGSGGAANGGSGGAAGGMGGSSGTGGAPAGCARAGCTCETTAGNWYSFCTAARMVDEAQVDCALAGMTLVRVDDATENQWIQQTAQLRGLGGFVFLGAADRLAEGEWHWFKGNAPFWLGSSSGKAIGGLYNNWASGEPNVSGIRDCMGMGTDGTWSDRSCTASSAYVCGP